jgi:hypothetical protein
VTTTSRWGALAEPPHDVTDVPSGAPWRDNAFLSFFDHDQAVCGAVHLSTSPSAPGRARASVVVRGRLVEVVEPLGPMTFTGSAIDFRLEGVTRVRGDGFALELTADPRFVPADYTALHLIPPLPGHAPLAHYQQGAEVSGSIEIDGERTLISGRGFRDRTWGRRDEAAMFVEYLAFGGCFDGWDLTLVKFLDPDGGTRVGGYRVGGSGNQESGAGTDVERVVDARITRSASGLLAELDVDFAGGDRVVMRAGPTVGFWAPMGVERCGPALAAYEECVALDAGGSGHGTAVVEHGVLRRLF